ncbi:MAG TPA: hypothetical protein VD907_06705 [Verrucomicrobiae bacterium]|nr:hypothetical protein [Verrucomicrobiae bacterium]
MKWKSSYFAFAMLFLWCSLSLGCGTKKKVVTTTTLDSAYDSKFLARDYQANVSTSVVTENTTVDFSEFKAVQTLYDTAGRKTQETIIEGRRDKRTAHKADSAARDSSHTKETARIDSGSVQKEAVIKNKDSDSTLLRNIGTRAMIIMFAIAIGAFFLYKWIRG